MGTAAPLFAADCVRVTPLEGGLVELCFDRAGEAINKLDDKAVAQFGQAVQAIAADGNVRGVLVTSAKDVFIVGADITEFGRKFQQAAQEVARGVLQSNQIFVAFEDLDVPTVVAINGFALGGGLELALSASQRVMSEVAQVGVPEVKLGLFPGFGGTVRLARVASPKVAVDWVVSGKPAKAADAQRAGVVDAVAAPEKLREEALALLWRCVEGQVDWRAAQERKRTAVSPFDAKVFDDMLAQLARQASKHQPAAEIAVRMMREAAQCDRTRALELEAAAFGAVTQTQAARSMVQTFLNEQTVKKFARRHAEGGRKPAQTAVIGAGIMGGGIAYTTALRGTPVRMKDIAQGALDLGMGEARRQLAKQVESGRLAQEKADKVLAAITPQTDDSGFGEVELAVEAVVENLGVKHEVMAALQQALRPGTVLASNTSSLRIDDIAAPLPRPEDVAGLHFFNPVPVMPLVEVVRGSRSSAEAVATATAYASGLGKTPIVVKDCPGFLVNRILTPYIIAFCDLVAEGADYEQVDRAMEAFGWPMGPAYLEDVVGMDTGSHVIDVISAGYPGRMRPPERNAIRALVAAKRLGQKSGGGFYDYDAAGGKPKRSSSPAARELIAQVQGGASAKFTDGQIVERMMLPMLLEAVRCIEESVVGSAAELDMAMLLGVGFPQYLGGPLQYADWLGLDKVLARCEALGLQSPPLLREMAARGRRFYRVS
ncbi:fatty acid oxidation complex subunit alpha FadB [Ramlibacter sp. GTP1]|uniref:enoyl-CoA hydratase n=2 Tax=Ramlibacter albus TaxID=2079448 RepID=A0A923S439_9BURK|nr:fatty acid oxidation complex subunit alpha FadB [Ramlibacter albus]